jgi:hypothetical protein
VSISELHKAMRAASDQVAAREAARYENSPSGWRALWERSLKEFYPECVVSYPEHCAIQLKRAVEKRGLPRSDMPTFIPWIVRNWQMLRKVVFSHYGTPFGPTTPDMRWVIRHLVQIHALYTALKPSVAIALPLVQRTADIPERKSLLPPAAVKAKAPPAPALVPSRPLLQPLKIDHAKARAIQERLGLPKWD